jgi:AbrB family looped-hinge helix DNA binding protein
MTRTLILDKPGRVVIPKALREDLKSAPGDALRLDAAGEQITLRPVRAEVPIRKEDGVWVFRAGKKVDVSIRKLIEEGREERSRSILSRRK